MIKLLTVIGARPQIIKAAALSRALAARPEMEEKILHTGQHYDAEMSEVFFRELGIPAPDYNLGVGSGPHGVQTAKMTVGIEQVLQAEPFDGVVLYGDTNSTLAGAVAAAKLGVPVFHVEAGLRSFAMAMPEEQNRIVCDHLSSLLFAPTQTAVDNLRREGLCDSPAVFPGGRGRRVVLSGDVMYDNARYFAPLALSGCDILQRLQLDPGTFVLATIHRPVNTDSPERLSAIVTALLEIAEEVAVVLPLHPRTRKLLERNLPLQLRERLEAHPRVHLLPPVSFFEVIVLEQQARVVLTDSGGVQKEAFFYGTPTVILRRETEWVEIIESRAGVLADADAAAIVQAYAALKDRSVAFPPLFGDAHAAERILDAIDAYLKEKY